MTDPFEVRSASVIKKSLTQLDLEQKLLNLTNKELLSKLAEKGQLYTEKEKRKMTKAEILTDLVAILLDEFNMTNEADETSEACSEFISQDSGGGICVVNDCSICLNTMMLLPKSTAAPCGHEFHIECIEKCLKVKRECPVCRAVVKGTLKSFSNIRVVQRNEI